MFINVQGFSSPTPISRVPNARLLSVLPSTGIVHNEEAAHFSPRHNTDFLQYSQHSAGMFTTQCVLCRIETV